MLAVVGGLLQILDSVNQLPADMLQFDTTVSMSAFVGRIGVNTLIAALSYGFEILLFGVAGEALYRQYAPRNLSLEASFSWRGLMTRSGAIALGLGTLVAAIELGYQIAYYIAGRAVGFWAPAWLDVDTVYNALVMDPTRQGWSRAVITANKLNSKALQYYAEARDGSDTVAATNGKASSPNVVSIAPARTFSK